MNLREYTASRIEDAVLTVNNLDQGRGYTPKRLRDQTEAEYQVELAGLTVAVMNGYVTPTKRGWGHRLTAKGKAVMGELEARKQARETKLRSAGFDPSKPVAQMTPEEVERFIAYRNRAS